MALVEHIMATRPWSFTATLIPILVTAAVVEHPIQSWDFLLVSVLGLAVHAGANLTNTYFDFKHGIDTVSSAASGCGDTTLFTNRSKQRVTAQSVLKMAILMYGIAFGAVIPLLHKLWSEWKPPTRVLLPGATAITFESDIPMFIPTIITFVVTICLSVFYTASPVALKYRALGDVIVFLCFGPLLMHGTAVFLSRHLHSYLVPYSVIVGVLTEAILHANNIRDLHSDKESAITTLAICLGAKGSTLFFFLLFVVVYTIGFYIAAYEHWGVVFALFLTFLPIIHVCKKIMKHAGERTATNARSTLTSVPEEVATTIHLPFGIFFFLGIRYTSTGFLTLS